MRVELNQNRLCLERNKMMKVRGGIGYTVVCHSGCVWLTQDGDTRDIFLHAGETFTFDRDGPALLQALEPGAISIARSKGNARTTRLPRILKSLLSSDRPAHSAISA
jgi:hypothetical protein